MRPAAAPRTAASLSQRARRADQRGRGRGAPEGNAAVRRRGRKKEASASDEDEHVAGGRRGRLLERESGAEEAVVAGGARSDGGAPEEQNGARGGGLEGGGADASGDGREGEAGGGAEPRPPQSERPSSSSPGSQASGTELQTTTFAALGLDKWLVDALAAMSIRRPTEIQCACILPTVQGRDVIGNAKTGSGKTAAFALPILQKLSEDPYGIFALVLTPTRELAFQINEQFTVLGKTIGLRSCVVVGGMDMVAQAIALQKLPHIVIATPGRLVDHINSHGSGAVRLGKVRFLVLDEADRLLSPTFAPDLEVIFDALPEKRQTLLYSATLTDAIMELKRDGATPGEPASPEPAGARRPPPFVYSCSKADGERTVALLEQRYLFVPSHVREPYLAHLLQDTRELDGKSAIVFVGRCRTAELLRAMLVELGVRCVALHSAMSQRQRLDALGKFRAEFVKVLVTTDVGSRGLDIPTVGLVVNFDVPRDPDDYIHRVGRTARSGRGGVAITIVSERDIQLVHHIEGKINKQLQKWEVPENEILENINRVAEAKRVATMHLHDTNFGERTRVNEAKKRELEAPDASPRDRRRRRKMPAASRSA